MTFGSFDREGGSAPMAEINMIPLIDVMLVLLVIFMVTAPLLTNAVKIELPKASSAPDPARPGNIQLTIDAASTLYWNGEKLDRRAVRTRFAQASKQAPQPELHLRADKATPYQAVAEVMADAARSGLTRIGFVSNPEDGRP